MGGKVKTVVLSHKTKGSVLRGRGSGSVVGTLIVCSVAKCKHLFRIMVILSVIMVSVVVPLRVSGADKACFEIPHFYSIHKQPLILPCISLSI